MKQTSRVGWVLGSALSVLTATSPEPSWALLITTQAGNLVVEAISGEGATSDQEFGLGTPSTSSAMAERDVIFVIHLDGDIASVTPLAIVNKGFVPAGSTLDFYNVSSFCGGCFAFSSALGSTPTASDLGVFSDTDNSLGFGGSIVEVLGVDDWLLHLDDAASALCCDDDDNEMVIRVRIAPSVVHPPAIAEPPPLVIALFAGVLALNLGLGSREFLSRLLHRLLGKSWANCSNPEQYHI